MTIKIRYISFLILLFVVLLASCTSTKNTATTRWYHSFNTRYNVYFNGSEAFKESYKSFMDSYKEDYSDFIYMHPVSSLPKDKQVTGGPFDRSLEKAVKAIKTHSIGTKPQKESGKRNDPKYQEFMSREEYNPFLHNAWMLMGISQFYNGDFLTASSTFSYISKHYTSQPEISITAKIWQARSYAEMGWFYEADDALKKANINKLSKEQTNWFSTVYADYLIKNKQYREAIPYLTTAIQAENNKYQKARMKYLLGQIYTQLEQKDMAYKTFGEVAGSGVSYPMKFSAKIRQTEVFPGGNVDQVTKMLKKMAKSSKNKDFLDQVYYAMGNVYMTIPDTIKAVESYKLGVEKSTQNGMDQALCQIKLGDIYFQQRQYVEAQPCYSEALSQLKKEHREYPKVSKRSAVLDELVVHYEAVQLQDSLQRLARMTEPERLAVVNKIISDLKKKEEEEKKAREKEEYLAKQEANREAATPTPMGMPSQALAGGVPPQKGASSFYFYNEQMVALGKNTFQQKWGRRKLEDNWRRRNKEKTIVDEFASPDTTTTDSATAESTPLKGDSATTAKNAQADSLASDPHNPEYYLQQIPLTEEDIAASNLIIDDGLFNMGVIYKEKLEDYSLAIETFNTLNTRFPQTEHKLEAYHHMYLMYLRMKNHEMAELYKSKIKAEFPESELAIAMQDPDYEYNMLMMNTLQDSIYEKTYQAYLDGKTSDIRKNYDLVNAKYTQSKLMPKFMFLNALTYVQTNEPDTFKVRLKELIEKYPDADVSVLAGEMMKGFQKGLTLSGDGNLAKGSLFNIHFGVEGDSVAIADSTITFSAEKDTPYQLMLVYPTGSANNNLMLYNVAEFNFTNFTINEFDLKFETFGNISMLQITGFNNYDDIQQYCRMITQQGGYANRLEPSVTIVPISSDNFAILMKGKSLDEYFTFFEKQFGTDFPQIVEKWKLKQETETLPPSDEKEEEKLLDVAPEEKTGTKDSTKVDDAAPEKIDMPEKTPTVVKDTAITTPSSGLTPASADTTKATQKPVDGDEIVDKANETAGDVSKKLDDANEKIDKIASDPIRGLKGLFSKDKKSNAIDEYVKQQEKEEKEQQKLLKKEQEDKAKAERELEKQKEKDRKDLLKKQKEEEEALLKEKEQREKDLKKLKEQEEKQKVDDKKRIQKEKDDARKLKEEERKAKLKQQDKDRKDKEKLRKEQQKKKEEERKAAKKLKDEERKAKQRLREEERK